MKTAKTKVWTQSELDTINQRLYRDELEITLVLAESGDCYRQGLHMIEPSRAIIDDAIVTACKDGFAKIYIHNTKETFTVKKLAKVKKGHDDLSEFGHTIKMGFGSELAEIARAYGDCEESQRFGFKFEDRNLNYFGRTALTPTQLCAISSCIIGVYNGFNVLKVERLIEAFGEEAKYFIARESSPCIYIKPSNNVNFHRVKIDFADEFSFDVNLNMFRVWWD